MNVKAKAAAAIYPITPNESNQLFRGRDITYWRETILEPLELLPPGQLKCDYSWIFIFKPGTIPVIESGGVKEILAHLEKMDLSKGSTADGNNCTGADEERVFSLEGYPFFILSRGYFDRCTGDNGDIVASGSDVYKNIETGRIKHPEPGIEILDLETKVRLLDIHRDYRAVENFIVDYQISYLTKRGIVIEDFNHFYIEGLPPIGQGTSIGTGVVMKGNNSIGCNTTIYPHVYLENAVVADHCTILPGCIIRDSKLEADVQIGPYTHLRNDSLVKKGAKMGNFVEMKKSTLGEGSKAMHLSYIGDAEVGTGVNIGAGMITCNYDGKEKFKTTIEDRVFIGSGVQLVAPITVQEGSYIAAGSTITEDVPAGALGIARQKQSNKPGWAGKKRK